MQTNDLLEDHENAERILQEGWLLFQKKGYRGVTVDELCQICRITKPTLYYYFKDKENLFVEILQHRLRGFHKVLEQPGSLETRLCGMAASILESFQTEYTALLRDREHIKNQENGMRIRRAFHDEMFDPLNALMQSGIESGELAGADANTLSLIYLGIINNFIAKTREGLTYQGLTTSQLAAQLTRFFLRGVQSQTFRGEIQ